MKKIYETPNAEKISFQYREQVVASNFGGESACEMKWVNIGAGACTDGDQYLVSTN